MKTIAWSVGESSGDQIAASLIREISRLDDSISHWGCGGPLMRVQGLDCFEQQEALAVNGFGDVLRRLPFFIELKKRWVGRLSQSPPDLLIIVDFPGFNQKLLKWAHKQGIKCLVIAPPQIWAWKRHRAQFYSQFPIVVTLPFEQKLWENEGAEVEYFGHPLGEVLPTLSTEEVDLWICPGSRPAQIQRSLKVMLALYCELGNQSRAIVIAANRQCQALIEDEIASLSDLRDLGKNLKVVLRHEAKEIPKPSRAWSALGTQTLELALLKIPTTVIHPVDFFTYYLGKRWVKMELFALPNILWGRKVFEEIIFNSIKFRDLIDLVQRPDGSDLNCEFDELAQELKLGQFAAQCSSWILRKYNG